MFASAHLDGLGEDAARHALERQEFHERARELLEGPARRGRDIAPPGEHGARRLRSSAARAGTRIANAARASHTARRTVHSRGNRRSSHSATR